MSASSSSVPGDTIEIPLRPGRPGQSGLRAGERHMSQEIIEHIRGLEREKGIEENTVIHALEDALLAAHKKTPGAARHATVELDEEGEFRVFAIDIPPTSARCSTRRWRPRSRSSSGSRRRRGEAAHADQPGRARARLGPGARGADRPQRCDPHDFGRIAAMTAKQVIQQRIREAERAMMYEEYIDRQGEASPASSSRPATATTSSSTSARSRRCCRARSRSTASATSRARGSRPSSPRSARVRRARR